MPIDAGQADIGQQRIDRCGAFKNPKSRLPFTGRMFRWPPDPGPVSTSWRSLEVTLCSRAAPAAVSRSGAGM
jgi:hypothetical protein